MKSGDSNINININIYLIHCKKFTTRATNCQKLKDALRDVARFTTISEYDNFNDLVQSSIQDKVLLEELKDESYTKYNKCMTKLSLEILSNSMKHLTALQKIAASDCGDDDINVILEDDVFYNADDIHTKLVSFANDIRRVKSSGLWGGLGNGDMDVVYFGLPGEHKPNDSSDLTYSYQNVFDSYETVIACDSYYISKKAATLLSKSFLPIRYPTNYHLSYMIETAGLGRSAYMCTPNIFTDGSKIGSYPSTINPNNVCIYNGLYKHIYNNIKTSTDMEQVPDLLKKNIFKNSPDFMALKALHSFKTGSVENSAKLFEEAFDTYRTHGCILNNRSIFMKNYIECLKQLNELKSI